jgi:RimK-like ATP-grasp domain
MPSKGGRRSGMALGTAGAPANTLDAAALGIDPARLARPLRLGPGLEVERLRELARQDELSPAESDELYEYRLRRLAARQRALPRVVAEGNEQHLRELIDGYSRRLRELRAFEEQRRQTGLPAGYAVDPAPLQEARRRLADVAGARPRGLLAGAGSSTSAAGGAVRLPEAAFAPTAEDAPLYLLAPPSLPSEALSRSIDAVAGQGGQVRLVHDAVEIPRDRPALVLNWGGAGELPADLVVLNRPEAVRVSSDQVESLRRLGDLAPRTVLNPQDLHLLGSERVVAKRRRGTRGSGKRVLSTSSSAEDLAGFDLYQELVADRLEYRVSVLSGQIVSAYRKRTPEGTSPANLRPAWAFERVHQLPHAVAESARRAAERLGLDYSGVDVVEDLGSGRVMCLEANAAPGMSEETVRSLYAMVQQVVRRAGA